MKRIISAAIFAFLCITMSVAQDTNDELYEYITVEEGSSVKTGATSTESKIDAPKNKDGLTFDITKELKDALKKPGKNSEQIHELTFNLTEAQRQELYDVFSKTKGTAIGMNWLPGFGSGSFVQGDGLGGGLGVAFDTIALISVGGGVVVGAVGVVCAALVGWAEDGQQMVGELLGWAGGLLIGGGVLWLGNKIFGTIRPITFAKNYNRDLKAALGLDDEVESISFIPIIDPLTSNYGMVTQIRF